MVPQGNDRPGHRRHPWHRATSSPSFSFGESAYYCFSQRAAVEELAGFGASVHTCSRNEAELGKCLKEWEGKGFVASGSACDASSRVHIERLVEQVASVFNGKLNILINNVGTNIRKPAIEYTAPKEYSTLMATNFESTYHLCQLAHPLLKASGMGSIVFISSVAGLVSVGSGIHLCSK